MKDFEHVLKILASQNIIPCKPYFFFNKSEVFFIACCFVCIVLFRFADILSL